MEGSKGEGKRKRRESDDTFRVDSFDFVVQKMCLVKARRGECLGKLQKGVKVEKKCY